MIKHYKFYISSKKNSGWRSFLVLKEGHKWVRLISTETAKPLKLKKKEYEDLLLTATEVQTQKTRLIERMEKFGDSAVVQEALELLRTSTQRIKLNVIKEVTPVVMVKRQR